jgi:hypothetical protein
MTSRIRAFPVLRTTTTHHLMTTAMVVVQSAKCKIYPSIASWRDPA